MQRLKLLRNCTAYAVATLVTLGGISYISPAKNVSAASFNETVEFEDANHFSSDYGNGVRNYDFGGYSGNGYVYLASGWADVNFSVPNSGQYRITIRTNSDQYKENWLYLDDSSQGQLRTNGNGWQEQSVEVNLSAGQHKFGVSTSWGYVALDNVKIESIGNKPDPKPDPKPNPDPTPTQSGTLSVSGSTLRDAKGQQFVMRGVNVAHGWFPENTEQSINAISRLGANCVRVVLCDGQGLREGYRDWRRTPKNEVQHIIDQCKQKGLVCILEVHDHTGSDDPVELQSAVNYWKDMADVMNANKDWAILNIANEWCGSWNAGLWTDCYKNAIQQLRSAGIKNLIMVDALGWGQDIDDAADRAREVLDADSLKNTMFSGHIYSVAGPDSSSVYKRYDKMGGSGVCFVVGEFGDFQNGADVDEATIMRLANEKQIGTIAWSWKGNGGGDASLDMARDWDGNDLTEWGKNAFYSSDGIKNTSKLANR